MMLEITDISSFASQVAVALFGVAVAVASSLVAFVLAKGSSAGPRAPTLKEKQYRDLTTGRTQRETLPGVDEAASLTVSIVFPAYDESQRLPGTLRDTINYLRQVKETPFNVKKNPTRNFTWEIIIVDDGSKDGTSNVALDVISEMAQTDVRVLTLEHNRGKGGAVAQGILHSRGQYILFADADGATDIRDMPKMIEKADEIQDAGCAVTVGSRAHLQKEAVVRRSALRTFLMKAFHTYLWVMGVRGVKDTQCGFKLFTRSAAQQIFPAMHVEGYIFDIEVLLLAEFMKIPVGEVPVNWQEIPVSV
jgi:dolichyl-phosphate beta-glucosyltransferase